MRRILQVGRERRDLDIYIGDLEQKRDME